MTINDIIALAHAGFNAQQIAQLAKMPQQTAQTPPTVQQTAQTQPTLQQTAQTQPMVQQTDPVLSAIQAMQSQMNTLAINGSTLPQPETTEDILASIINPKEEVKK